MLQVKRNVNGYWLDTGHHSGFSSTGLNRLVRLSGSVNCALPARLSALTLRYRPLSRALANRAGGR